MNTTPTPQGQPIQAGTAKWLEAETRHAQFVYGGYEIRDYRDTNTGALYVYVVIDSRVLLDNVFDSVSDAYDFVVSLPAVPNVTCAKCHHIMQPVCIVNRDGVPVCVRCEQNEPAGAGSDSAPAFAFGMVDEFDLVAKCLEMGYTGEREQVAAFEWYVDNASKDPAGVLCYLDGILCYVTHADYDRVTCGTCGATYAECAHDDAPSESVAEVLPAFYADDVTRDELISEIADLRDEVARLRAELETYKAADVVVCHIPDIAPAPDSAHVSEVADNIEQVLHDLEVAVYGFAAHWRAGMPAGVVDGVVVAHDYAGDIRGEACLLWRLLVAIKAGK